MIASFTRPDAAQPWRKERITLRTRRIKGGIRVYVEAIASGRTDIIRKSHDYASSREAWDYFDRAEARFLAAGFTPAR